VRKELRIAGGAPAVKSSVDAEPVNSSAGLPDTVIELGDRLRRYPVRIVNTVERTVM
jgi:hypothetical protein